MRKLLSHGAACWLILMAAGLVAQEPPPNILFIAVDDLRPELGCYGQSHVQSPYLDRFASQAVVFTNHFVQVPTCGASRYALLTGRSPMESGALGNQALYQGKTRLNEKQLEAAQSFPELFRRSGYRTVCIGKISHTADGKVYAYNGSGDGRPELPHAWDELATPYGSWKRGWGTFFAYHNGRHREDGKGNRDLMEFVAESDDELPDGLMASTAIAKLGELKQRRDRTGQPFLMGLGFFKPHLPFVATRGDWEAFDDAEIPLPASPDRIDSVGWHRSGEFYKYNMTFEKSRPLNTDDQLVAKRAYLACVRYVDRQIGRVLTSLRDQGLAENTIVVVWGDHGWHLGESAIWGKHSPFDRSLRSTLMIRAPGVSLAGHRCDQLVETLDLYPTLVDLCQPKFRKHAFPPDGKTLRSLLQGADQPIRDLAVSYFGGGVTGRSRTHRFIAGCQEYPFYEHKTGAIGQMELYNHQTSPDPASNIRESEDGVLAELVRAMPRKKKPEQR